LTDDYQKLDLAMKSSPNRFKDIGRGVSADMSPRALTKRIRILDQLWATSRTLRVRKLTKG